MQTAANKAMDAERLCDLPCEPSWYHQLLTARAAGSRSVTRYRMAPWLHRTAPRR